MRRLFVAVTLASMLAAVPVASGAGGSTDGGPRAQSAGIRTYIACIDKSGNRYIRRYRPSRCGHFSAGGSFGGGVDLHRIKWSSYNGRIARGRALECGFRLDCTGPTVSIKAYRRVRACGHRVYTRLKATSRFGSTVVPLRRCSGSA